MREATSQFGRQLPTATRARTPEQIKGADDAYLDSGSSGAGDTVQTLHVLKDNMDFWLQMNHLGFGGATAESDPGADRKVLKRLARTIVRRLD